MKKQLAGFIGMICSAAIATAAPAADIPYPDALADANVTVTSLANGNADGLLLGNGDLYGLVWERGGELIMRVTKNDIWDARLTPPKTVRCPKWMWSQERSRARRVPVPVTSCPILNRVVQPRYGWARSHRPVPCPGTASGRRPSTG